MAELDPAKQYLDRFRRGLRSMPATDREEMVREIESHIAEATAAGTPLAAVLDRLGPADRLARGYTAEALLAQREGRGRFSRWPRIIGLVAATSVPSVVIVFFLGLFAVVFTFTGGLSLLFSVLSLFQPPFATSSLPKPLASVVQFAMGAVLLPLGLLSGRGLMTYVRFVVRTIRKALAN